MVYRPLLLVIAVYCVVCKTAAGQCTIGQMCVTDLQQSNCPAGTVLTPNTAVGNCCPSCQALPGTGQGSCAPPFNCLNDGSYAPVQCKGDMFIGRCFCTDKDGNRIFGQMWRDQASEMTCACSRRRAELESAGRQDVTLHCTSAGDFEPLQCDDGLCWCAQPKTGQPTGLPVLEQDMSLLPCYSEAALGEQYLRKCESLVFALAKIHREQTEHGTSFLGNPVTFCDYDGTYGPYQILNGIAYCTDRDGEILGSWQIMSSEMAGMNCNCARDTILYFPERGATVTEVCLANGNYRPNQNVGDTFYCVDGDGYPVGELGAEWPTDNCASHA